MITEDIRQAYPGITKPDLDQLTPEEFNKLSIKFHEDLTKDYKVMLGGLFKDKDTDYPDWYKDLLREGKTHHEKELKKVVFAQKYLRDGLNPPFVYQKCETNPFGFEKKTGQLDSEVTLVFKNKEGETIELGTTLKDLLERTIDDFYEDLEPTCTSSSCNNESQNFCDCGSAYEEYEIDSVIIK